MTSTPAWLLTVPLTALLTAPPTAAGGIPASHFTSARDELGQQALVGDESGAVPWFERVRVRAAHHDSTQQKRSLAAQLNLKTPGQYNAEKQLLAGFKEQRQLDTQRLQHTEQRFTVLLSAAHTSATPARADIDLPDLLSVDQLATFSEFGHDGDDEPHSVALDLALLDANIARKQLQREQGSSGFGLRFLELRRDSERNNSSGDYRLTVGIDLPTGRTFAASEKQIQYNDAEHRMHQLHRRQTRERAPADEELKLLVEEHRIYRNQLADLDARLERHDQSTPVPLILDLKREQLNSRSRLIGLEADIYRRYIDAIHLRGLLPLEPLRNWLAVGQPTL